MKQSGYARPLDYCREWLFLWELMPVIDGSVSALLLWLNSPSDRTVRMIVPCHGNSQSRSGLCPMPVLNIFESGFDYIPQQDFHMLQSVLIIVRDMQFFIHRLKSLDMIAVQGPPPTRKGLAGK
jgi:hypothetical protein